MILIGFLFYRSHVVSGRPGFRIDGVLSRGTLKWVTWSHLCGELKPLHTWHFIFLGSYLSFLLVGFWCLLWSSRQTQVHRKRISYGKLVAFSVLEVCRLFLFREVLPFSIWFYLPLLDYDVSLHDLVKLFVAIPTSPRTSKTESGWSRYLRFRVQCFCSFLRGGSSGFGRKFRPSGSSGQISGQSSGRVQYRFLVAFLGVRKFLDGSSGLNRNFRPKWKLCGFEGNG